MYTRLSYHLETILVLNFSAGGRNCLIRFRMMLLAYQLFCWLSVVVCVYLSRQVLVLFDKEIAWFVSKHILIFPIEKFVTSQYLI